MGTNGNQEIRWHVIHTYSGYEERVKANLEQRIKSMGAEEDILQVEIPVEKVIKYKEGQRETKDGKLFPGYVLVQMRMNEQSWQVVRNTPGVIGFVGVQDAKGKLTPVPLSDEEVQAILKRKEEPPKVKVGVSKGQSVRIIDGPFMDFIGVVDEVKPVKSKVKVLVSFFGRETPLELDLLQVEAR